MTSETPEVMIGLGERLLGPAVEVDGFQTAIGGPCRTCGGPILVMAFAGDDTCSVDCAKATSGGG